jgi:hypothetical protein
LLALHRDFVIFLLVFLWPENSQLQIATGPWEEQSTFGKNSHRLLGMQSAHLFMFWAANPSWEICQTFRNKPFAVKLQLADVCWAEIWLAN